MMIGGGSANIEGWGDIGTEESGIEGWGGIGDSGSES